MWMVVLHDIEFIEIDSGDEVITQKLSEWARSDHDVPKDEDSEEDDVCKCL